MAAGPRPGAATCWRYVWDLETRRELPRLVGHEGIVAGVAFTADGRRVVTVSPMRGQQGGDGTVRLWDVETGHERRAGDLRSCVGLLERRGLRPTGSA